MLRPSARAAIVCAGVWALTLVLFPLSHIAFTSMAQTLAQILVPPEIRGRMVGLFNTAILGLRAGLDEQVSVNSPVPGRKS